MSGAGIFLWYLYHWSLWTGVMRGLERLRGSTGWARGQADICLTFPTGLRMARVSPLSWGSETVDYVI